MLDRRVAEAGAPAGLDGGGDGDPQAPPTSTGGQAPTIRMVQNWRIISLDRFHDYLSARDDEIKEGRARPVGGMLLAV